MVDAAYAEAVQTTFETKPLRTVLMIDDEFPTLHDLAVGPTKGTEKRFRQQPLAIALYDAFRESDMLCDIENVADEVRPERIRKSDLIILDYHLGPDDGDTKKSISILRELASSKHFNTVVVYTAEPDLNKVWLEIIASLGGAWKTLPGELEEEAKTHWERFQDEDRLPSAPLEAVMEYARVRDVRGLTSNVRKSFQQELVDRGVPQKSCSAIIETAICVEMAKRAGEYADAPKHYAVGEYANGARWIQSRNTFITILKKDNESTADATDPAGVLACLRSALLNWRPNLIQILVSEIQNILELEALISDDELLRQSTTQAALWHFLLNALEPIDPTKSPDVRAPLTALIDRIVEGVRRRLATDPEFLELAGKALLGELRDAGWSPGKWPDKKDRITAVNEISRTSAKAQDVFFRLNSFLSTEAFRRAHITCGTLIQDRASDECFVAASPACDLVPRAPGAEQIWLGAIHPLRPLVCVKLHNAGKIDGALGDATHGRFVFIEEGGSKSVYALTAGNTPAYEIIFLEDAGIVRMQEGKKVFSARRIVPAPANLTNPPIESTADKANAQAGVDAPANNEGPDKSAKEWACKEFEVIGQLRPANANRVLQLVTQHLSRIGLDFIDMPQG